MLRRGGKWLLRHGAQIAVETVVTQAISRAPSVLPQVARLRGDRSFLQVFDVTLPITVFIYAEGARVTIKRIAESQVRLEAALRASFGWQIVAEQDAAGVYIVAKRKPVVGGLARAEFTVSAPAETRFLAQFSAGTLLLENLDGTLDIPPIVPRPG